MSFKVYLSGQFLDEHKASIDIHNRAFLYGEGLFETLRVTQSIPLFLKEHLQRLKSSAASLKITLPVSVLRLKSIIDELLVFNRLREATVKIHLSRSSKPSQGSKSDGTETLLVTCKPFESYPVESYLEGIDCHLVTGVHALANPLSTWKSTNYLVSILAKKEAEKAGAQEGILTNLEGNLTEGAMSNLFIIRQKKIFTPPLSSGLLPGITRGKIFKLASKLKNPVIEKTLKPKELIGCDEAFLTSSLKGILPIRSVNGKNLKKNAPGPLTTDLMESYQEWIQLICEGELS